MPAPGSKWQAHIALCRIMRQHPDWTDEQVLEDAGLHVLEMNLVKEARREVAAEHMTTNVQTTNSWS